MATGETSTGSVNGKIVAASPDMISIQASDGTQHSLKLDPSTQIMVNGKNAHSSDLKKGQDVRASFSSSSGEDVATTVTAKKHKKHKTTPSSGSSGSTGSTQ